MDRKRKLGPEILVLVAPAKNEFEFKVGGRLSASPTTASLALALYQAYVGICRISIGPTAYNTLTPKRTKSTFMRVRARILLNGNSSVWGSRFGERYGFPYVYAVQNCTDICPVIRILAIWV